MCCSAATLAYICKVHKDTNFHDYVSKGVFEYMMYFIMLKTRLTLDISRNSQSFSHPSFSLSFLLALPVTRTRAHPLAHRSCVNARALPHHRARRVRTWWRRVRTTPLTSPPPRPSRLSREPIPCSQHEAGERTQR